MTRVLTLASAVVAIAVGVAIATLTTGWSDGAVAVLVVAAALVAALALAFRWTHDPLAPLVLVLVTYFVLYVLRPLFVLSTHSYGPTTKRAQFALGADAQEAMLSALGLVLLALASLMLGYAAWRRIVGDSPDLTPELVRDRIRSVDERVWMTAVLVAASLFVAVGAYYSLIASVGGIGAYIDALSQRSGFFFGRGYLNLAALPLKVVTLLLFCHAISAGRVDGGRRVLLGGLIFAVLVGDFLSGGRAAILTGTMLPLLVVFHYVRRRLPGTTLAVFALIALLMFVSIRVLTRDAVYAGESQGSANTGALVVEAVRHLPDTTVGGQEAIPFDSLLFLQVQARHGLNIQHGRTYLPIFTFPVPRSLWPEKPLGGGNAWFTSTFFPKFYGPQKTETSISMIGEAFANFGRVGVPIVLFLFGLLLAAARWGLGRVTTPRGMVMYAVTVGYSINVVRGDAFQSVTRYVLTIALVWFFALLMQERSTRAQNRIGAVFAPDYATRPSA